MIGEISKKPRINGIMRHRKNSPTALPKMTLRAVVNGTLTFATTHIPTATAMSIHIVDTAAGVYWKMPANTLTARIPMITDRPPGSERFRILIRKCFFIGEKFGSSARKNAGKPIVIKLMSVICRGVNG